jgi:chitinase
MKNLLSQISTSFILLAAFLTAAQNSSAQQKTKDAPNDYIVQAYLPFWGNYKPELKTLSRFSHIALAFALPQKNGDVTYDRDLQENLDVTLKSIAEAKKLNPNLKCLWAIGGWGNSDNFTSAVRTENRHKFIKNLLKLVESTKCDGIDIDWEFPKIADRENLTAFIKELSAEIAARRLNYQITMAVNSVEGENNVGIDVRAVAPFLHHINVMTYDFYGDWSSTTGHHTAAYKSTRTMEKLNASAGVDYFLKSGVPSEKIVIGAAFYGRIQSAEAGKNGDGLGEKSLKHNGFIFNGKRFTNGIDYRDLKNLPPAEWKRFYDDEAHAPYLYNARNRIFISYDDARSLAAKIDLIKNRNLGGIMVWELTEDAGTELTDILLGGFGK